MLAVDWGTSALRGALLASDGTVLAEHAAPRGLLQVPAGGWAAAFEAEFGGWRRAHPGLPCLMAGMVGSRQGWVEAPYCPCPAGLPDVARQVCQVSWPANSGGPVAIVPGLSTDVDGVPDVMRGEETQVFGALQRLGLMAVDEVTLVLPGTHSKWVTVQRGHVTGFATHLTGEVYGLLRHQSLLARMLPADDSAWDSAAFDAGVLAAQQPGGLLHHVFAVRSLALFGQADGPALASRLSGLLIGEELRAQAPRPGAALVLVGSDGLVRRYQHALALLGLSALSVGSEATWAGLLALAGTLPG